MIKTDLGFQILGNATVITDNPPALTYVATLPTTGGVQGSVSGTANTGGKGGCQNDATMAV